MIARYRPARLARETAPDGVVWVGAIPDGPITALDGVGPLVLDVLGEADGPLTAEEITGELAGRLEEVPDDAASVVAEFLEQLARLRLVIEVVA